MIWFILMFERLEGACKCPKKKGAQEEREEELLMLAHSHLARLCANTSSSSSCSPRDFDTYVIVSIYMQSLQLCNIDRLRYVQHQCNTLDMSNATNINNHMLSCKHCILHIINHMRSCKHCIIIQHQWRQIIEPRIVLQWCDTVHKQPMELQCFLATSIALNVSDLLFLDMIIGSAKVDTISCGSVTLMDAPIAAARKILMVTLCLNTPH